VKHRIACYYYWDDLQCLGRAVLVAEVNDGNFKLIERWSNVRVFPEKLNTIGWRFVVEDA
jgi:hypothetical protein